MSFPVILLLLALGVGPIAYFVFVFQETSARSDEKKVARVGSFLMLAGSVGLLFNLPFSGLLSYLALFLGIQFWFWALKFRSALIGTDV